MFKTLTTV